MAARHANKIELCRGTGSLFDYVIDGRPLVTHLRSKGRKDTDYISPFGVTSRDFESQAANWLLLKLKSPFPTGRVPLLFCPTCADLGCGAITAKIERVGDLFVWKEFGFETPTNEFVSDLERYRHVRGFRFTVDNYLSTFRRYAA